MVYFDLHFCIALVNQVNARAKSYVNYRYTWWLSLMSHVRIRSGLMWKVDKPANSLVFTDIFQTIKV